MLFLEFDKEQAEWVVVAYFSGDAQMIDIIESGEDPHIATGHLLTDISKEIILREDKLLGHATDPQEIALLRKQVPELNDTSGYVPRNMTIRQAGKKSNHGLNYDEGYETFSLTNEIEIVEAKRIVALYHTAYPQIRNGMHEEIKRLLSDDRILTNCFGRKVRLLDAWGHDLFRKGYSFVPQSTVVDLVNEGMISIYNDEGPLLEPLELMLQGHDSLTYQYPEAEELTPWSMAQTCIEIAFNKLNPLMEYHGREFHIKTALKIGKNLKDMEEVKLTEDFDKMKHNIMEAVETIYSKQDQCPADN